MGTSRTLTWIKCEWLDTYVNIWRQFWYDDTPREILRLALLEHRPMCAVCLANGEAIEEYMKVRKQ